MAQETVGPDADQRRQWLATLTSLLAIRDTAEQLAASAALSAAQHGADYPEIGDAAGMSRQGARRKWPGLAGLADRRQRELGWWNARGDQFLKCARAVLAAVDGQDGLPWAENLRARLDDVDDSELGMILVDAHAVALNAAPPADPDAARSIGLLAALTADAYATTNGHSSLVTRTTQSCALCSAAAIVVLLVDREQLPFCHEHAISSLRDPHNRIMAAYRPEVALEVMASL
jgi:hypothetical protein